MALRYADAMVDRGLVQCPFSTVSSRAQVGRYVHVNFGCYVAHDCEIGDFVTLAPAAQCLGRVHVGRHAFVGAGAIIRQGTRERPRKIGAGAVIGMGAVVLEDVAPGETVVGNPARVLR
jgi:acetyltransferase-like isoleucine patch superfamily enzyme